MDAQVNYTPAEINDSILHSIDAHQGKVLTWRDIEYSITVKDKKDHSSMTSRTLLHPMSGEALPGELLAVMGTSGAGKSTLLDVLAGRLVSNDLKGSVNANGVPVDLKSFRKETAYVMQSDALFPLLTVRETFRYAAYFRIANKTVAEKDKIVETMINLLHLDKVANSIVGNENIRGLSGGEKRRVSIGVDIIHFPSIIFLDEPTSGLDSHTALSVVETLKSVAAILNCTVILTIHQPSSRIFSSMDKALFLCAGEVTYSGTTSGLYAAVEAMYRLADFGPAPVAFNPPEEWLDLSDRLIIEQGQLSLMTSRHNESSGLKNSLTIDPTQQQKQQQHSPHLIAYANSLPTELFLLTERAWRNIIRTPELFLARLIFFTIFSVMLSTLFLFTKENALGVRHRASFFSFITAGAFYTSLEALPIFSEQREIFQREFSGGAYRAYVYTIAYTLVMLPVFAAISVVSNCIVYWLIGLPNHASTIIFQMFVFFTDFVVANSFATMFSVLIPSPITGNGIATSLFSVMFLLCGLFITSGDIPSYWIWLHYLSLFKYSLESFLVNSMQGYVSFSEQDAAGNTVFVTNHDVLDQYSLVGVNKGTGVGVMWLFTIFFRLLFWYRLVTRFNGSRK